MSKTASPWGYNPVLAHPLHFTTESQGPTCVWSGANSNCLAVLSPYPLDPNRMETFPVERPW